MTLQINGTEDLPSAAGKLLGALGDKRVVLFYGDMGAGKTTFIKVICEALAITDVVSSPTFSIVNEYSSPAGPVYHFDFYRLKNEEEALDLGCEDYFYSGNYCFVEWPEKISSLLPENFASVSIGVTGRNRRTIVIE